jgi:hypothetical protein
MEKAIVIPPNVDPTAHEKFYQLVGQVPESEAACENNVTSDFAARNWRIPSGILMD